MLIARNGYKTGVEPLGQKQDVKNAVKNLSEDLPPICDIEAMFDHLVSRVSGAIERMFADRAGTGHCRPSLSLKRSEAQSCHHVLVSYLLMTRNNADRLAAQNPLCLRST